MLTFTDLRVMASARVQDARALAVAGRYDGAVYIVGYAVEYVLKARIATSLLRTGTFPQTSAEFKRLQRLQSHDLDELLKLSGRESKIKGLPQTQVAWSYVLSKWTPEVRYAPVGSATAVQAGEMIRAVELLLRAL